MTNKRQGAKSDCDRKGPCSRQHYQRSEKAGVLIQEDRTLVELMRHLTVDDQIPEALYETVAEIFSFIYRLDESVKIKVAKIFPILRLKFMF